jgi:hypothetical protein
VQKDLPDGQQPRLQRKNVEQDAQNIRRARHGDLRVTADNDGVGMVARMAPTPRRRLAQHHEASDVIDGVVHPARPERRAVAVFVPPGIGG